MSIGVLYYTKTNKTYFKIIILKSLLITHHNYYIPIIFWLFSILACSVITDGSLHIFLYEELHCSMLFNTFSRFQCFIKSAWSIVNDEYLMHCRAVQVAEHLNFKPISLTKDSR